MPLYSVRLGSGAAQPRVEELTLATGGRIGALRRALKDSADLVFVDPPHVVDMPTSDASRFDSDAAATPTSDADTPRAWWFAESREDGQYRKFVKFEETLRYLRNILEKEGPFDGIFGFSQGAACGAILTALVEQPSLDRFCGAEREPGRAVAARAVQVCRPLRGLLPARPARERMLQRRHEAQDADATRSGQSASCLAFSESSRRRRCADLGSDPPTGRYDRGRGCVSGVPRPRRSVRADRAPCTQSDQSRSRRLSRARVSSGMTEVSILRPRSLASTSP